jgi:hypothetical protein
MQSICNSLSRFDAAKIYLNKIKKQIYLQFDKLNLSTIFENLKKLHFEQKKVDFIRKYFIFVEGFADFIPLFNSLII